jgi:hypothetical protein
MEQRQHQEVTDRIYDLVSAGEPGVLVMPLRELAREELRRGYPREALVEDFERVRSLLEDRDEEAREDDVLTVMDALTGYCSPAARL